MRVEVVAVATTIWTRADVYLHLLISPRQLDTAHFERNGFLETSSHAEPGWGRHLVMPWGL
jgi:hypothetical protein